MPRYYRNGRLWYVLWYGLRHYPRWGEAIDPVHPSRARGWALGPREGCILDSPGIVRAQRRWAESVKVWYRFRVPCVNNGLVWAGGHNRAGEQAR